MGSQPPPGFYRPLNAPPCERRKRRRLIDNLFEQTIVILLICLLSGQAALGLAVAQIYQIFRQHRSSFLCEVLTYFDLTKKGLFKPGDIELLEPRKEKSRACGAAWLHS